VADSVLEDVAEVTLGEVADLVMGQSPPGSTYNEIKDGLPFIQGSAEFGAIHPEPIKWCSAPARVAQAGDLLVSVRAPVGDINYADEPLAIGRGLAIVRGREEATTRFLALAIEAQLPQLRSLSGGGMFESVTKKGLSALRFRLPPVPEQRRIADLVSCVDAASQHGLAAEAAARQLLQALTRWLCPTTRQPSREAVSLEDLAQFINGRAFKPADFTATGVPVIRIRQINDPAAAVDLYGGSVEEWHRLSDGDLVFSWSGSLTVLRWTRGDAVLNQHLFKVIEREGVDRGWLTYVLRSAIDHFEQMTHGTTMKHITRGALSKVFVERPPIHDQQALADALHATEEVVQRLRVATMALVYFRRRLLTVLLSGEGEIPESYDRFLEEQLRRGTDLAVAA